MSELIVFKVPFVIDSLVSIGHWFSVQLQNLKLSVADLKVKNSNLRAKNQSLEMSNPDL